MSVELQCLKHFILQPRARGRALLRNDLEVEIPYFIRNAELPNLLSTERAVLETVCFSRLVGVVEPVV